jgi:protein-S-isoprenylcysteine O-methyltransferase Ste14
VAAARVELKGTAVWAARAVLIAIVIGIAYLFPPLRYWPMWIAAAAWIAFSVYWGVAAKGSADAKTSESAGSRRLHVRLTTAGQLLLFLRVPGLRQSFVPNTGVWIGSGLAILVASVGLAIWARRHLGRNWSGRIETKVDHQLVRSGPYRKLRHPIYTAVIGMCVGTALIDGHVHALVGVAMVVGAYWRKVRMEEANLRQAFGAGYLDYRRATWGAIPGLF